MNNRRRFSASSAEGAASIRALRRLLRGNNPLLRLVALGRAVDVMAIALLPEVQSLCEDRTEVWNLDTKNVVGELTSVVAKSLAERENYSIQKSESERRRGEASLRREKGRFATRAAGKS